MGKLEQRQTNRDRERERQRETDSQTEGKEEKSTPPSPLLLQRCSSQYTVEGDDMTVTRGCMKPAHCHAKNKKDNFVACCDSDYCNTDADFNTVPGTV